MTAQAFQQGNVFDAQGTAQTLGNELARGGEGVIYPLAKRPEVLVKCYHAKVLQQRGDALQQKVGAMMQKAAMHRQGRLAWPQLNLFDAHQQWIGYAMYRHPGVPLFYLAHPMLCREYFPDLTRQTLTSMLLTLINQIKTLHAYGVFLGDVNLHNILCNPDTMELSLIDCDSYQITLDGTHYPCPVGSADMTPLEHQDCRFETLRHTRESETFAVAILLFKCLMLGRHPYDIVGGSDPVSNLKSGRFAYGKGNRGVPAGSWYKIWSHMPFKLKSAFITTFQEGATAPEKRTSLATWASLLEVYQRDMKKGWHNDQMVPEYAKSGTYRGQSASRSV